MMGHFGTCSEILEGIVSLARCDRQVTKLTHLDWLRSINWQAKFMKKSVERFYEVIN